MKENKQTDQTVPELVGILIGKVKSLEKAIKGRGTFSSRKLCCGSSLKKCELSYFFYFLMDEGILFFDEYDEVRNRSKMQMFLEKNFSYRGDGGQQTQLKSVSREFSEAKGYTYREKQLRLLERIIKKLEYRKQNI